MRGVAAERTRARFLAALGMTMLDEVEALLTHDRIRAAQQICRKK